MKDSLNVQFNDTLLDWSPNVDTGYNDEISKEDSIDNFAAAGFVDFPDHLWIEPKDWEDYAAQNDKYQTWARDYSNRFTNQSPTTECTCHCLLQCAESTYNKQRGGITKNAVWFSALGVYEEADPSGRSGASVVGVLKIAMRRGMVPEYDGPDGPGTQKAKYKFTRSGTRGKGNSTQSGNGSWLRFNSYPSDFELTSRHFKPLEIINIDSWEQHFCLLLHGYAVGNGRNGHSIPHMRAVKRDGVWYSEYKDSYDRFLYDSISTVKRGVNAAYCIASFTQPDDWSKPAGNDMIG
jgi:hypothetical protein